MAWPDRNKCEKILWKISIVLGDSGCLPFTKISREIQLENLKEHDFLGLPGATEHLKS